MGYVPPVGVKFGDDLALVCDLPLSIRNLLLNFRQTYLKGRLVHSGASRTISLAYRRRRRPSQSSSASRLTAGAAGFLTLTQ
jgi:hypothetical protein